MSAEQIRATEKPTVAFVLSLLAGLWMFSAGGMMGGQFRSAPMGGMGGWMWGRGMQAFGMSWPWFGILGGIVVLFGAVMLYVKPEQRRRWGLAILIISALDVLVGMGGLLAGALGVIGGVLALTS